MPKSKNRKNRRSGPHRNLKELASARAGKNFARKLVTPASEGKLHRLTLMAEDSQVVASTIVTLEDAELRTDGSPELSSLMAGLATAPTAGLVLETLTPEGKRVLRCWLSTAGTLYPATAEEAEETLAEDLGGEDSLYADAYRLT